MTFPLDAISILELDFGHTTCHRASWLMLPSSIPRWVSKQVKRVSTQQPPAKKKKNRSGGNHWENFHKSPPFMKKLICCHPPWWILIITCSWRRSPGRKIAALPSHQPLRGSAFSGFLLAAVKNSRSLKVQLGQAWQGQSIKAEEGVEGVVRAKKAGGGRDCSVTTALAQFLMATISMAFVFTPCFVIKC